MQIAQIVTSVEIMQQFEIGKSTPKSVVFHLWPITRWLDNVNTINSAGLTMGPMEHVPRPPAEGPPSRTFFLRPRELVVGCTARTGHVYRDL